MNLRPEARRPRRDPSERQKRQNHPPNGGNGAPDSPAGTKEMEFRLPALPKEPSQRDGDPSAQGCSARATLGPGTGIPRTLKGFDPRLVARNLRGVVSASRRIGCNPFRVGLDFGTGTQGSPLRGQPWAEGDNPFGIGEQRMPIAGGEGGGPA